MNSLNHPLSDMVKSDLISIAKSLPATGANHELNIINYYLEGGWELVNEYIDETMVSFDLNKPAEATFSEKVSTWVDKAISFVTGLYFKSFR